MCEEKCVFKLWTEKGLLQCTNKCELDKEGVDDIVSYQELDSGFKPGDSIHGRTHLCQVHNNLRLRRDFLMVVSVEESECMESME